MAGLNLKSLQNLSQTKKPDLSQFSKEDAVETTLTVDSVLEEVSASVLPEKKVGTAEFQGEGKIKKISLNQLKTGVVSKTEKKEKTSSSVVSPKIKLSLSSKTKEIKKEESVAVLVENKKEEVPEVKEIAAEENIALVIEPEATVAKAEAEEIVNNENIVLTTEDVVIAPKEIDILPTETIKNIDKVAEEKVEKVEKAEKKETKDAVKKETENKEIFPNYDFTKELNLGAEFMPVEQTRTDGVTIEKNKECTEIAVGVDKPIPSFFGKITKQAEVDDVLADILSEVKESKVESIALEEVKKVDIVEKIEAKKEELSTKEEIITPVIAEKKGKPQRKIITRNPFAGIKQYQEKFEAGNKYITAVLRDKMNQLTLLTKRKTEKAEEKKQTETTKVVEKTGTTSLHMSKKGMYALGAIGICTLFSAGAIIFSDTLNDAFIKTDVTEITTTASTNKNTTPTITKSTPENKSYKEGVDYSVTKIKKKNKSKKTMLPK